MVSALHGKLSWKDHETSLGWDVTSFLFAVALHLPLFFMKFDNHKKSIDAPSHRLVAIDLIEPELPKPVVEAPPPPIAKENSLMERLKALVKHEPPPPPPEKKPVEQKLAEAPKAIPLAPKLDLPEKLAPKLESKAGFQTQADPNLVKQQQLAMNVAPTGIAPLSAKKLGTLDDRAKVMSSKGAFHVGQNEQLSGIGNGPALAGAGAPVIALPTGKSGSTEKFSAPVTQKSDKGRIGAVPDVGLGGGKPLGLRDAMIARDAAPTQIGNTGGRAGGVAGGIPGGTGSKRNAGSFQGGAVGGSAGGISGGTVGGIQTAPRIAETPRRREKPQMFTITGPLKDRKIERQVVPEYPAWAQAQGISASVVLEFTVDPTGVVKSTIVVRRTSGYPKLDQSAIDALSHWKFVPLADGENRDEVGLITFNYSLS
jgi:TonB family protein